MEMNLTEKASYLKGLAEGLELDKESKEGKIIVKKVNVVTKHVKPRKMVEAGGLIETESALYACKVQLVCPKCGEATRVGHKKGGIRVCKNKDCGHEF